jgi:RNA polymerase sigma-32 factor
MECIIMTTLALPVLSSDGSGFARYLAEIKSYPLLEPAEEYTLARRWLDHGDLEAAHRLVTSHLRLVVRIAKEYSGYHLPLNEVVAEGTIGLMQAVKKFDPEKGFRLTTYAVWWIRAAIQEYVIKSWSVVRIGTTAAQKKLFFNLRRIKVHIQAMNDGDLMPDQANYIADVLDVPLDEVVEMNRRMQGHDSSLNAPLFSAEEETGGEWQDFVADDRPHQGIMVLHNQEKDYHHQALMDGLKTLNERDRAILIARKLQEPPATLEELSERFSISRERVRQIEAKAFDKLQALVKKSVIIDAKAS